MRGLPLGLRPGSVAVAAVAAAALGGLALIPWSFGGPAWQVVAAVPFAAVLGIAVARPAAGLALLIGATPYAAMLLTTGHSWSVPRCLALAALIGAVIGWIRQRRLPRVSPTTWAFAALIGLGALSLPGQVGETSIWHLGRWTQSLLLAVLIADVLGRRDGVRTIALALGASAAVLGLFLMVDYVGYAAVIHRAELAARYVWGPWSPAMLALIQGAGLMGLLTVLLDEDRVRWRAGLWFGAALAGLPLTFLACRGAWVALAVALVVLGAVGWRRGRALRIAGIAAALVFAPLMLGLALGTWDPGTTHRVEKTFESAYQATSGRTVMWTLTWRIIREHPLRGVGLGNVKEHYELQRRAADQPVRTKPSRSPHNELLRVAAELGLPAVVVIWVAIVWMARRLVRRRTRPRIVGALATMIFVVLLSMTVEVLEQLTAWVVIGLALRGGMDVAGGSDSSGDT